MSDDMKSCIYKVPVFQVLPRESVERLQHVLRHAHFEPGETVMNAGDPVRSLIVVARGRLQLVRTSKKGREQIVRDLQSGDFFGEMALFTDLTSEGDLKTVEHTGVCMLERSALQAELQRTPGAALPLVEAVAKRLADAERTIGDISLLDVRERLAAELIRMSQMNDSHNRDCIEFDLSVPWAQLAMRIGTTPESLSRGLKRMSDDGILQVDGRRVIVLDGGALRDIVDIV